MSSCQEEKKTQTNQELRNHVRNLLPTYLSVFAPPYLQSPREGAAAQMHLQGRRGLKLQEHSACQGGLGNKQMHIEGPSPISEYV